jgi:hypothetical protein
MADVPDGDVNFSQLSSPRHSPLGPKSHENSHPHTSLSAKNREDAQSDSEPDLPRMSPRHSNVFQPECVDLTMLTSDAEIPEESNSNTRPRDLVKAERLSPKIRLVLTNKPDTVHGASDAIIISDSDDDQLSDDLPPLTDAAAISSYPMSRWENPPDRPRFMICVLQKMQPQARANLRDLFAGIEEEAMWTNTSNVVKAYISEKEKVRGMDATTFKTYSGIIRLFDMYIECTWHDRKRRKVLQSVVQKVKNKSGMFRDFYQICHEYLMNYEDDFINRRRRVDGDDEEDSDPLTANRRRQTAIKYVYCDITLA